MRRVILAAAVLACILLVPSGVALAQGDDDIPGAPMTVGSTVTGVVDDDTDKDDVYAVHLVSGEQVQLDVSDPTTGPRVEVTLIAPGATSIHGTWKSVGSTSSYGGSGQLVYTPAKDGVYYILVEAVGNGVVYTLSLTHTGTPAVTLPDSDDIFGVPIGIGAVVGVVDDDTDRYDVYAVSLFAQEQVQLDVSDPTTGPRVEVTLIAPGATSIHGTWKSVGSTSSYGGSGQLVYTPAKDGVYYILVEAVGNGVVYTLTLRGSAEKPPYPTFLRLRGSATSVKRGRSVTVSATLVDQTSQLVGGETVSLQNSADGKSWSAVKSLSSSSGRYSAKMTITRSTWFRMTFTGSADHGACVSRKLLVKAK